MRVSQAREKYLNEVFGLKDPELERVRSELHAQNVDFMSISGSEGRILQFLVRAFQIKKIVEIGTLFGYSALCMAKALPHDGILFTLEKNPVNFETAQRLLKDLEAGRKIQFLLGDGKDLLAQIETQGPFDLVFIDADKAGYTGYLDWAEKNVRRGGLIVGDNTFLFGALWGESRDSENSARRIQVMTEFNQRLSDPQRYNSIIIPTLEGMTVAQKL